MNLTNIEVHIEELDKVKEAREQAKLAVQIKQEELKQARALERAKVALEKEAEKQEEVRRLRDILTKAEIKRYKEKLTKKELCVMLGFNYNFYMNVLSHRNDPSAKMCNSLIEYLQTPTDTVYRSVFATRVEKTIEEDFHRVSAPSEEVVESYATELKNTGYLQEPVI